MYCCPKLYGSRDDNGAPKITEWVGEGERRMTLPGELENPARALIFLTAATGLRVSEALGLKWSDVDFAAGEIRLSRAVVHQHVAT